MKKVNVLGLGAGELDQLSVGVYRQLQQAQRVYVRTIEHPVIKQLQKEGIQFSSFDSIYEAHDSFENVYEAIVQQLLELAEKEVILYAVPGHPLVAETTVQKLIEREQMGEVVLDIIGGNSFLDPMFAALRIDPIDGFQLVDGTAFTHQQIQMTEHVLIGQVYDAFIASEVKLELLEKYAYDHLVSIVTAAGTSEECIRVVPLAELDHETTLNNLTTVYVPPVKEIEARSKEWSTYREIIARLRGPEGCPWDQKQTHESLIPYLLEEAHEFIQAVEQQDDAAMADELGDLLLQVFLHAQIGTDSGYFTLEDVLHSASQKMIRRHPHVFTDEQIPEEELANRWAEIKATEHNNDEEVVSRLSGHYYSTSSLQTAYEYQKAAAKTGFDWPSIEGAEEKFLEEWTEFKEAQQSGTKQQQLDELGDVLFTIINMARFLRLSPEEAMVHANAKFAHRFRGVEKAVQKTGRAFESFTLEELENLWQEVKRTGGSLDES